MKNFFNKFTNNNRIFSYQDVLNMPNEEGAFFKDAIDYQARTIGLPTNEQLQNSSDVIYVHAYTRDDGTNVRAHYRSKAGHAFSNPNKPSIQTAQDAKNYIENWAGKVMGKDEFTDNNSNNINNKNQLYTELAELISNRDSSKENWEKILNKFNEYSESSHFQTEVEKFLEYASPFNHITNVQYFLGKSPILTDKFYKNRELSKKYYNIALNNATPIDENSIFTTVGNLKKDSELKKHLLQNMNYHKKINDNTPILVESSNSKLSQAIKNSSLFQNQLKNNKNNIINGYGKNKSIANIEFPTNSDLGSTIGHAHIYNAHIDKDGCLNCTIPDYYDFSYSKGVSTIDWINNAAYFQQENGQLKNYILIAKIKFNKKETDEILNL